MEVHELFPMSQKQRVPQVGSKLQMSHFGRRHRSAAILRICMSHFGRSHRSGKITWKTGSVSLWSTGRRSRGSSLDLFATIALTRLSRERQGCQGPMLDSGFREGSAFRVTSRIEGRGLRIAFPERKRPAGGGNELVARNE